MKQMKKIMVLAIASIVFMSSITAYVMSEYNIKATKHEIQENFKKDMQTYMNGYVTYDEVETKILEQSGLLENDNTEGTALLDEVQIDSISDTVMENIKPNLIKDLSSKTSTVSQETIDILESTITSDINKVLANQPQPTISKEEKESLTNTIIAFAEAETLKSVNNKYSVTEGNINALKNSVNEKINKYAGAVF